jgi:hypothetical protein
MGKQNGNMGKTLALNRDSFFFFRVRNTSGSCVCGASIISNDRRLPVFFSNMKTFYIVA